MGPNISVHRFFPDMRFVPVNPKYSEVSQRSYSPRLGPVGCLPAPSIFHLANEFGKGKMFWNAGKPTDRENLKTEKPFFLVLGKLLNFGRDWLWTYH